MTKSRVAFASAVLLGLLLLGGCLFPSFDQLGANRSDATDGTDGGTPASSATTTPTTRPTADATTPAPVDAGTDATVTRVPNGVPCRGKVCGAPGYCCANMILDTDDCRAANDDPDLLCAAQAAGDARAMRCDGPEDCSVGVCCFVDQAKLGAFCATTCAGTILCHETTHCPVGQTCSGSLFSEYPSCR